MLPAVALKVIELVSDPDVTVMSLAPVVSKDQVLASRVLGLGNSAAYAGYQPATTVIEAMVRLGTVAVRNVVVTVSFASRMHDPRIYGEQRPRAGRPRHRHRLRRAAARREGRASTSKKRSCAACCTTSASW